MNTQLPGSSRLTWALIAATISLTANMAWAEVEEASAEHIPWSGYWWPIGKGELLGPLVKYDEITGDSAAPWELQHNPPGPSVPAWHGYCHGWAAASVLEREPRAGGPFPNPGPTSKVNVADQKAWLAVSHAADLAQTYGDRFGDGIGSEDIHDIAPDVLWHLLRAFIKQERLAIIMDLDPGPEVWNYPVYAYRIEHEPHIDGNGLRTGQLSLWAAEDAVPPNFVGLLPHFQTYSFEFRMDDRGIVLGSGKWTGESLKTHPDFAWYPVIVQTENPELNYTRVKHIVDNIAAREVSPRPTIPGFDPSDQDAPLPVSPAQLVLTLASTRSAFFLDMRLASLGANRFAVGDRLSLRINSERSGYLYLLHVTPKGELSLLFPRPEEVYHLSPRRDSAVSIPAVGRAGFKVSGPFGNHLIKAVVSERPLLLTGLIRGGNGNADDQTADTQSTAQPGGFRLCSTQYRQVKSLLVNYLEAKTVDLDAAEPRASHFTRFAQDEVIYYVGPAD